MPDSNRAIKPAFLIFLSSITVTFPNTVIGQSEFSGSYKCTTQISNGLGKENGVVKHQKFYADSEFFVTHISDFPDSVLDAWLSSWNATEAQMQWNYGVKRETVSDILFEEDELMVGEGYRIETGSYWLREASKNPLEIYWWHKCEAYSFNGNSETRITCDIDSRHLFQMNTKAREFTYAYLGTLHAPKTADGYEGDTASVRHGTCKLYYP